LAVFAFQMYNPSEQIYKSRSETEFLFFSSSATLSGVFEPSKTSFLRHREFEGVSAVEEVGGSRRLSLVRKFVSQSSGE